MPKNYEFMIMWLKNVIVVGWSFPEQIGEKFTADFQTLLLLLLQKLQVVGKSE